MRPFTFTVVVEVERDQGKFMSRDDIVSELLDALESADPGSISGGADGDSEYSTTTWEITDRSDEK